MSRIKGSDTKPELLVRSIVHRLGYRFSLHRRDLPGSPDIVLPKHKKIIFVHGCFWHSHKGCNRSQRPSSNIEFWQHKLEKNIVRDKKNVAELRKKGWAVLILWQCQTRKPEKLIIKIEKFLGSK